MPRLNSKSRLSIFRAALRIARKPGGWSSMTREAIAARAGCAESLVSYYYSTMEELRGELMNEAMLRGHADLLAQGITSGYVVLNALSKPLQNKVIAHLHSL